MIHKVENCLRFIVFTLLLALTQGCEFAMSPPLEHNYVPLYPDTIAGKTLLGLEAYYWPFDRLGLVHYGDTALFLMDAPSSSIEIGRYSSLFHLKGKFRLGIEPFGKAGLLRVALHQKNIEYRGYDVLLGGGIRIMPHLLTKHFILGMTLLPLEGGILLNTYPLDTISEKIPFVFTIFPEMIDIVSVYAYFVGGGDKVKVYMGPILQDLALLSLNGGIGIYKNKREFLRLMLSAVRYEDNIYRKYNLYPYAFMVSVQKPF